MLEKLAMMSIALMMVGSPSNAGKDANQALRTIAGGAPRDAYALQCKAVLQKTPKTWIDRLQAGRCDAWREMRIRNAASASR